jgi:hypothetical protein
MADYLVAGYFFLSYTQWRHTTSTLLILMYTYSLD